MGGAGAKIDAAAAVVVVDGLRGRMHLLCQAMVSCEATGMEFAIIVN